jgi:hypothetical protein
MTFLRADFIKSFTFTNRRTYLLVLDGTKIYIKIHTKMHLHVTAYAAYAATPLHVYNGLFLPKFLTIVTLAKPKYKLPDDGHRPKYVGAFSMNFNVNFGAF